MLKFASPTKGQLDPSSTTDAPPVIHDCDSAMPPRSPCISAFEAVSIATQSATASIIDSTIEPTVSEEPVSAVELPRGPASKTLGKKLTATPIAPKTPRKKGKTPRKTITKLLEKGRRKFSTSFTPRPDHEETIASTSQLPTEVPTLADSSLQFAQPSHHPFDRPQANPELVFVTDDTGLPHAKSAATRLFLDLLQLLIQVPFERFRNESFSLNRLQIISYQQLFFLSHLLYTCVPSAPRGINRLHSALYDQD